MREGKWGWHYPAGAANDPNAPWNQSDEHCPYCCPCHEDSDWEPHCGECEDEGGQGTCYLYAWLPHRIAYWLSGFRFFQGRFPGYCEMMTEPECKCCECEPDYDDSKEGWR